MSATDDHVEYVTATVGGQLFGFPIARVQDVFIPDCLTRVPLAPPEIAGLLNVRGRVLTLIDMRRRLGLPAQDESPSVLAVGMERNGESYGLLVDQIAEVLKLPGESREDNPIHLDRGLAQVSGGVHRLERGLMIVLDLDRVLEFGTGGKTALAAPDLRGMNGG